MGLLGFLEILRLALEVYKAIKGKPESEKAQIKAQIFDRVQIIQGLKHEVEETGDLSKVEDALSRHSLR